ncbi:MAG: galactokinase, partial [Candidatus Nanopelagicales bacterium]
CPELNVAVDSAQRIGAYGARMMGGGFGGSAIALLPRQLLPKLTEEVTAQFTAHGFTAPKVYQVTASQGAHVVQD